MSRRVMDQAYYAPLFWANRIIVSNAKLKNWKLAPSQFLNLDLADVWLDK